MTQSNTPTTQDEFFMGAGFHKHKQGYKGKGLYYSVGGYDIIKDDAKAIFDAVNSEINKVLDELENDLLDKSVGLENEETAVKWDDVVSAIQKARRS